jgi:hypothetical protein
MSGVRRGNAHLLHSSPYGRCFVHTETGEGFIRQRRINARLNRWHSCNLADPD